MVALQGLEVIVIIINDFRVQRPMARRELYFLADYILEKIQILLKSTSKIGI